MSQATQPMEAALDSLWRLIDCVTDQGLIVVSSDGQIRAWNAGATRITGYSTAEAIGQSLDFLVDARSQSISPAHCRTRVGEPISTVTRRLRCKDGSLVDAEVRMTALNQDSTNSGYGFWFRTTPPESHHGTLAEDEVHLLQAAVDGSPAAIFIKDLDGRYQYVNRAAIEYSGRSRDQIIGRADADFFDVTTSTQLREHDRQVIESGQTLTREEVLVQDGKTRICRATKSPYRDRDGRVAGVLGVACDISALAQAKHQGQQTDQRLRLRVDNARVVIWEADPATLDFTYVSDFCQELLGYSAVQWREPGFWAAHLYHEDARQAVDYCLECTLRARDHRFEYRMVRADGGLVWVDDSVKVVVIEGRVTALYGALVDITERKQAEQTLRDSELRYRAFVEHATDAMFLHLPEGCVVDLNRQACESLGYAREELIGQFPTMFDADVTAGQIAAFTQQLDAGETISFDSRHRRKDGTLFPVSVRIRPFRVDGRRFALALAKDITQRKVIEEQLRAKSEQYRLALDAAELGTWRNDLLADEFWMDERCQLHHGLSRPMLSSAELFAVIHPDDRQRVHDHMAKALDPCVESEPSLLDVRIVHGDGSIRWLSVWARPNFQDHHGERRCTHAIGTTLDITERKLAEEQLLISERRVRELADAIPQIVWTATPDGSLDHLNARAVQYTGVSEIALTGWSWESVIHPDDLQFTMQEWSDILQSAEPRDVEFRIRRADGSYRWHVTRQVAARDAQGNVTRWYGTCTDIEDRRCVETALRESEERFRNLVELAPDGFAIIQQGSIVYANRAAVKLFGADLPEALIGSRLIDFMHPDERPAGMRRQELVLQEDQVVPLRQFRIRRLDGTWMVMEFCAGPCRHHGLPAIQLIARDVSERTRTEVALRESEERFRQIAAAIDHVFWMTSYPDGQPLYVSPAFATIWGRATAEFHKNASIWLDAIAPQDRRRVQQHHEQWMLDPVRRTFETEYRIVRPDGEIRWVFDRGTAILDERGNVYRLTGVAQDITEKKKLETQFHQAQKMEAVGQLAGGIAHDFNNLLMVVSGFSELLLEDQALEGPPREAISAIRAAGIRAASLTRQLLAFSRKQILEPVILDLNELVRQAETMIRRLIREDVSVSVRLAPDLMPIKADAAQIDQVLLNLILNARDAMPSGGSLTIETENVQQTPGLWCVCLRVRDTGSGMNDEAKSKIFEPFFTTKPIGQGTGLGMAVVHGIVSQSGGQIRLDSELGRGTTVELLLPVSGATTAAQQVLSRDAASGRGAETILLAEDEPAVRRIVRNCLELQGYTVLEAEHGASALEIASRYEGAIHLLLTDVVMPVMGGRRLAEILATQRPNLKALYMSGYANDESLQQGLEAAAFALLQKPFEPDALVQRVREILDQEQANGN